MSMGNTIREWIPPVLWKAVKKIKTKRSKEELLYECPVCLNKISSYKDAGNNLYDMYEKYQFVHSAFCYETFNKKEFYCPECGSADKSRLYALYLKERFEILKNNKEKIRLLDIAPDKILSQYIKNHDFIKYKSADLYMEDVDDKIDITDMNIYKADNFDIILCSHVLEHIENDGKALSELYRILNPEGFGLIMVPIDLSLEEDFEDPARKTEEERWKYFGQSDHVRIYSKKGFVEKLINTGFIVKQLGIDYFGEKIFIKSGISKSSVLYIVEK